MFAHMDTKSKLTNLIKEKLEEVLDEEGYTYHTREVRTGFQTKIAYQGNTFQILIDQVQKIEGQITGIFLNRLESQRKTVWKKTYKLSLPSEIKITMAELLMEIKQMQLEQLFTKTGYVILEELELELEARGFGGVTAGFLEKMRSKMKLDNNEQLEVRLHYYSLMFSEEKKRFDILVPQHNLNFWIKQDENGRSYVE